MQTSIIVPFVTFKLLFISFIKEEDCIYCSSCHDRCQCLNETQGGVTNLIHGRYKWVILQKQER